MILQPLVENCDQARALAQGRRRHASPSAASSDDGRAVVEVVGRRARHDRMNGWTPRFADGIGLSNVNERLRVIYGARCAAVAAPARSAAARTVQLEIPDGVAEERASA